MKPTHVRIVCHGRDITFPLYGSDEPRIAAIFASYLADEESKQRARLFPIQAIRSSRHRSRYSGMPPMAGFGAPMAGFGTPKAPEPGPQVSEPQATAPEQQSVKAPADFYGAYLGQSPFTEQQLVFIVKTFMQGALDRIMAFVPPVVSRDYYKSIEKEQNLLIAGALQTVGAALPILYAQLTGDGMGNQEFEGWLQFERAVDIYVETATSSSTGPCVVPDVGVIAEKFVQHHFAEYLSSNKA